MGEKQKAPGERVKVVGRVRRRGGGLARPPRPLPLQAEDPSSAIQHLFEACRDVFKGPGTVPSPKDVQILQLLLDKLKPEDVGLSTDLLFFKARTAKKTTPAITYTNLYNCDNFSMCIFFLPPTAVIPLHNHPGMTVFSKLLLGTMHIKSYDLVDDCKTEHKDAPSSQSMLAKMVEDSDFTAPCETSILYPTTGGNIHTFRSITPCAVLDILGPPYSKDNNRDCTYYKELPFINSTEGGDSDGRSKRGDDCEQLGWLEEMEMPKSLRMVVIEYLGPQIIDDSAK